MFKIIKQKIMIGLKYHLMQKEQYGMVYAGIFIIFKNMNLNYIFR